MKKIYAILGAGNGGQAMAGYLSSRGCEVRLYDCSVETVEAINALGTITLSGVYSLSVCPFLVSTSMQEVVDGADIVMVVNPSMYHDSLAKACAPYLKPGQIIFLHPGGTFGAFAFRKALEVGGCVHAIPIAESNTLLFACRSTKPGFVEVAGKKERILVATLPADRNHLVMAAMGADLPEVEAADNVLVTSLDNTNPIVHPAPTLLNASTIEGGRTFLYYHEGISPSIGRLLEAMDGERVAIGMAMGLVPDKDLFTLTDQYRIEYNTTGHDISDIMKKVSAYAGIKAPGTLRTRYLYEDIPMGLVPLVALGKQLGISVRAMDLVVHLGEIMLGEDFSGTGRNTDSLGFGGMSALEIRNLALTGGNC